MDSTCTACGRVNASDSVYCSGCGKPLVSGASDLGSDATPIAPPLPVYIPNNLALAIVATVLCWPFGVAAIVYSTQVDSFIRLGQYEIAQRNADLAKKWSYWAIGLVIAAIAFYFLIFIGMFGLVAILSVLEKS